MSSTEDRLRAALADRYSLERELGAGGMATVYLAQDLKHRRQVAIKVLRPDLAAALGPDRFIQEIEIAARLQHPHILGVHDSGSADGFLYYVMPYVAGESLRERLARQGELPVHEAVRLLSEVADAIGYAHQQGVVHRDIKPENVMVSGRHALVMDFGVAKALSEASGRNRLTTMGVALGTPAYMAPEQASADPHIDHRVDIYALGVLGYELLAGRPPFTGASPQQVLAAHVTQAPEPVSTHRPTISPALAAIIMKALAKRPADRWQSAEEMLTQLEPLATPSGGLTPTGTVPTGTMATTAATPPVRRLPPVVAAVAVGAIAVAAVAGVVIARRGAPVMVLGTATQISAESPGLKMQPSISSDGEWVAYVSGSTLRGKIYVSRVGGGRPIALTDDTVNVEQSPRFSPDGKQVLFLSRGGAYVAPAQGGRAEPIVAGPFVSEAAWSPTGDRIAFVRRDSLYVRGVDDAAPRVVRRLFAPLNECAWSPDAELLACTVGYQYTIPNPLFGNLSPSGIVTISLADGAVSLISDTASVNLSPVWASGRRLYFVTDVNHQRDIFSIAVTADGRARGTPSRVTSGLGVLAFGLAGDGRQMVYTKYSSKSNIWSLPLNASKVGTVGDAAPVTAGAQTVEAMNVSRDGQWLLFDSDLSGTSNIFRIPVGGGTQEQLTRGLTHEFAPDLSPDGTLLAFHSFRTGSRDLIVMPLDGGPVQQVTATRGQESYPVWAPDGKSLHFMDQGGSYRGGAVRHGPDGTWVPENPKIPTTFWVQDLSPDGRYFTGILADSVRPEAVGGAVAVVPVDGSAPPRVYRAGATDGFVQRVQWHPDGGSLVTKQVDEGIATFWSIPAGGGPWRMIARLSDPLRLSARWDFAVDRTHLYFTLDDRQSDLWVVDVNKR